MVAIFNNRSSKAISLLSCFNQQLEWLSKIYTINSITGNSINNAKSELDPINSADCGMIRLNPKP